MSTSHLVAAALEYLRRGWSVLPVKIDKKPALAGWKHWMTVRPSEAQVIEWFRCANVTGVAIVCGDVSGGLIVRDFDDPESYSRWATAHPELAAALPTALSGRGVHLYAQSFGGGTKKFEDGELRRNGAYILAPPSLHHSGAIYRWHKAPAVNGQPPSVDPVSSGLARSWIVEDRGAEGRKKDGDRVHRDNREHRDHRENTDHSENRDDVVNRTSPVDPAFPADPAVPVRIISDPSIGAGTFGHRRELSEEAIEAVIARTLPTERGQHDARTMDLARELKFTLRLELADARPVFRRWFDRARPSIAEQDADVAWFKFSRAYEIAALPPGSTNLAGEALRRADSKPCSPAALAYESTITRRLIGLMAELQAMVGLGAPFALSCHQIATLLDTTPGKAHVLLAGLRRDGVIECVDRGRSGHPGKNAARFRFLGLRST